MRTHIIEAGIVVNTIMATVEEAQTAFPGAICIDGSVGGIGWAWDGVKLTPPPRWPDLDTGKAERHSAIKATRDQLETEGFPYLGKRIDSDPRSVQRINTTGQAAQAAVVAGKPFSIEWTCADNSTLSLDAAGMIGMPGALAMHANELHQHARTLKEQVEASTSIAELEAIDISSGWPGGV